MRKPEVRRIAGLVGVEQASISRFFSGEQGKQRASYGVVIKLARLFSVSARWLATGEGPKKELAADVLVSALKRPPPELLRAIQENKGRWTSSTLAEALHPDTLAAKTRSDRDGNPAEGWPALLDDIQGGFEAAEAETEVVAVVAQQSGPAQKLPM